MTRRDLLDWIEDAAALVALILAGGVVLTIAAACIP